MKEKREIGIDVLKILSMYLIVVLHTLSLNGILIHLTPLSGKELFFSFISIIARSAVNCYALASGYIGYNKSCKYSRLLKIWLQVMFYSICCVLFFIMLGNKVNLSTILTMMFPITTGQYWYISSYFGLFLFIPILNFCMQNMEKKLLKKVIITSIILFSLLPTLLHTDPFILNSGYSVLWLTILYLIGGYLKKYDIASRYNNRRLILIFILANVITLLSKIFISMISLKIFNTIKYDTLLFPYTSFTTLFSSISLLLLISKIKFFDKQKNKFIIKLSTLTLGVYLIHTNPIIWNHYLDGILAKFVNYNTFYLFIILVIYSLALYSICSIIEYIRFKLFDVLKINFLVNKIVEKIKNIFLKIKKRVNI